MLVALVRYQGDTPGSETLQITIWLEVQFWSAQPQGKAVSLPGQAHRLAQHRMRHKRIAAVRMRKEHAAQGRGRAAALTVRLAVVAHAAQLREPGEIVVGLLLLAAISRHKGAPVLVALVTQGGQQRVRPPAATE
jgi:hypothetical protein